MNSPSAAWDQASAAKRASAVSRATGQGQQGDQGDGEDGLEQADSAMGDADGRLGEGNADGAVDSQGRALDALRKGAQSLAEAMQQGDGDQPGDGPGNRAGRQKGGRTEPIRSDGRCMAASSRTIFGQNSRRNRRPAGAPDS